MDKQTEQGRDEKRNFATMATGGPNSGGTGETQEGVNSFSAGTVNTGAGDSQGGGAADAGQPETFSPAMGGTGTGPQHGGGIADTAPAGVGTGTVPPVGTATLGVAEPDAPGRTSTTANTAAGSSSGDLKRALNEDDPADTRAVADGTMAEK